MRALLVLAAALLAPALLGATAAAQPLDLRGALRYALAHDPAILARRATLAQQEAAYAKDHALELPQVAGTLQNQIAKSRNFGGTLQQFGLTQATAFSQNTAQIAASFNLYNGSLAQITAQEAKRQSDAAREELRRGEQQLATDVAAAWYAAVQKREALRLAEGDLAYQSGLLEAARAQERVGRVAGVDVLRAQTNALRSEAALASARADETNARENLAQRIGAAPETPFALPAALPEPPLPATALPALVARALAARPDLGAAAAQVALARLADAAIESDRRPSIQLQGAFGNQETTTANVGFVPGATRNVPGFWQFGAISSFTLPLAEYGARRAAHAAARAQLASAQASLETSRGAVEIDVRQALRAAQTTRQGIAFASEEVRYGRESARIAQLQYRNGLISLTDASAAQQTALSAENDLVNAQVAYLNALVRLRVAVGTEPLAAVEPGGP